MLRIIVLLLFFSCSIAGQNKNLICYYKMQERLKKSKMTLLDITDYIKNEYQPSNIEIYEQSSTIIVDAEFAIQQKIQWFLENPEKIYNKNINPENARGSLSVHVFYSLPKSYAFARKNLIKEILFEQNSNKKIQTLLNLQGKQSFHLPKMTSYYEDDNYVLKNVKGTDGKLYLVFIRFYPSSFVDSGTAVRFSVFNAQSGNICHDITFPIIFRVSDFQKCSVLKISHTEVIRVTFKFRYGNTTQDNYFLINEKGTLLLQSKGYARENRLLRDYQIGQNYRGLPKSQELDKFLYSGDLIESILTCKILHNFEEKHGNQLIENFLRKNNNKILKDEVNYLLKKN